MFSTRQWINKCFFVHLTKTRVCQFRLRENGFDEISKRHWPWYFYSWTRPTSQLLRAAFLWYKRREGCFLNYFRHLFVTILVVAHKRLTKCMLCTSRAPLNDCLRTSMSDYDRSCYPMLVSHASLAKRVLVKVILLCHLLVRFSE